MTKHDRSACTLCIELSGAIAKLADLLAALPTTSVHWLRAERDRRTLVRRREYHLLVRDGEAEDPELLDDADRAALAREDATTLDVCRARVAGITKFLETTKNDHAAN